MTALRMKLMRDTNRHQTFEYASGLHSAFWSSVPQVKKALDACSTLTNPELSKRKIWHPFAHGFVTWSESIGGRKRFFDEDAPNHWTQRRNHPVQSTAGADILKQTSILLARWFWENDIDAVIVNMIHDEFIVECREEVAERVYEKMGELMTSVGEHYCPDVPISSSGYIDTKWVKD